MFYNYMKYLTWKTVALGVVLVIGVVLRFWGNSRGLPDVYVNDEIYEVNRALQLLRGDYDYYRSDKGFYYYILTIIYYLHGSFQVLSGSVVNLEEYISHSIVYPAQAVHIGRLLSASLGVVTIFLIYRLGRRIFPRREWSPELLLAFAWTVCWPVVFISNWSLVENTLVFLAVLSFFPILNIYERGYIRDYIFAAVLIAMASASKIYGITMIFAVMIAHLALVNRAAGGMAISKIIDRRAISFLMVFVFVFAVLDVAMVAKYLRLAGVMQSDFIDLTDIPVVDAKSHMMFYLNQIRWGIGNIFTILLLIGTVAAVINKKADILIILFYSYAFVFLIGLHKADIYNMHYILITLPGFFICGVYGIITITDKINSMQFGKNTTVAWQLLVIAGVAVAAYGWIGGIYKESYFWADYTPVEVEAKIWVEGNVSVGSTIVMLNNGGVWPVHQTIPLYNTVKNYSSRYEAAISSGQRFKNMEALPDLAKANVDYRYDLLLVSGYQGWLALEDYIENGAEFFVIEKQRFNKAKSSHIAKVEKNKQSRVKFYESLKESDMAELEIVFEGKNMFGEKRTIEIYKTREKFL